MKNKDERFVRRRWALPVLVVSVLFVVVTVVQVYGLKDNGNFYLQDVSGDRVVLDEVELSGSLRDGYHNTDFVIQGGVVATRTTVDYLPETKFPRKNQYLYELEEIVIDDLKFRIMERRIDPRMRRTKNGVRIYIEDNTNDGQRAYSLFLESGLRIKEDNYRELNMTSGLAKVGDVLYYTMPTTEAYTGTNRIYRVDLSEETENPIEVLSRFDLGRDETGEGPIFRTLGLEAIGENLALILLRDDELVVRHYDPYTGEVLGEEAYKEPRLADLRRSWSWDTRHHAYINEEERILTLKFLTSNSEPVEQLYLSYQFKPTLALLDVTETSFPDSIVYQRDVAGAKHKHGKLFVAEVMSDVRDNSPNPFAAAKRFYISVYENNGLVYQGILAGDQNDDLISGINARSAITYIYGNRNFRHFYDVMVE